MANGDKLPVAITGSVVVPAEQSGSLVTRGLEAIKSRQRTFALVVVDADPEKLFCEGVEALKRGDFGEAVKWFRRAADQGLASAQANLAAIYAKGEGILQDYAAAAYWYRKAAHQGNARAQFALGFMYQTGQGVPQDYAEAVKWYRVAAHQGYASAQFNLGDMYYNGRGVPQDNIIAYMWFDLAAARGKENAGNNRDIYVARRMTPAQIAEAQRLGREWKPK
jgi:TPR repeat protein